MDKKHTLLGIFCILAGLGLMVKQNLETLEQKSEQEHLLTESEQLLREGNIGTTVPVEADRTVIPEDDTNMLGLNNESLASIEVPVEAIITTLSNDFIEVDFTTNGGAIRKVSFLQTKKGKRDVYVFNEANLLPALSLNLSGSENDLQAFTKPYAIESQSSDSITFVGELETGILIKRIYTLSAPDVGQDPYNIKHKTIILNDTEVPKKLPTVCYNLGTAQSISDKQPRAFLNIGYFDGKKARFTDINKLMGNGFLGFLGFGNSEPLDTLEKQVRSEWVSVKNQFFASILSSGIRGSELFIHRVDQPDSEDGSKPRPGISASVGYDVGTVASNSAKVLDFDFYVGPKEFKRLQAMDNQQDRVMQFGFLSVISKLLLSFMYGIHKVVPNWGWSIVIMTICIKLLFWPLSAKASRSQKQMSKIQEPMKELREKHKDNPQKLQKEMIELFRKHKVNPVAGCLPMIIQMPIFFALFYMLRTASELRHESFLWVRDLSMPDTLTHVAGFPINLLPLIMGITMFYQMRMVPVSPTADPAQQKIFKFLPFIFLIFLYNFSSGLVLYWTVQNFLTVIQQKIVNRLPDEIESKQSTTIEAKSVTKLSSKKSRKKH